MMFDALLASKPSINLPAADVRFVKALIAGDPARADAREKRFLFDIVANKTNGIDVDKFDYIARDYRAIGEQTNTSFLRLIHSARVVRGAVCYALKDAPLVYGLCQTRFWLHKTYYSHKTARAIEYMLVDALLAAEPHLRIAGRIRDPARFLHLTDSIMDRIQESTEPVRAPAPTRPRADHALQELAESRAIFRRLVTRDLYRLVDSTLIAWDTRAPVAAAVTPEAIVAAVRARFADAVPAPALLDQLVPAHVLVDVTSMP
jgi:HD superfamily phosphohydrolase